MIDLDIFSQDLVYPPELDAFVDKLMLFKVEVSDDNFVLQLAQLYR